MTGETPTRVTTPLSEELLSPGPADVSPTPFSGEYPLSSPSTRKQVGSPRTPEAISGVLDGHPRLARMRTMSSGLELLRSPTVTFDRLASVKEVQSREVASQPIALKDGIRIPVFGDVLWVHLRRDALIWLSSPLNVATLIWIACVAVSGALLFMVMTGMLNGAIPRKETRDTWFEVNNQILNGLFTFMCIIVQPARIWYAVRLHQWRPQDIMVMRETFNKGGTRKPQEWKHMLVVVILLNLNCAFQYCLAGLNWGYSREERPAIGVAVALLGAIGCAAAAGLYNFLSPLGKDSDLELLEEGDSALMEAGLSKRQLFDKQKLEFMNRKPAEKPKWSGGVLSGYCNDLRVGVLSTLCCICIFGINHERLGLGNKFVHMITFALFLFAPFLIFVLAAVNINNEGTRHIVGGIGIGISVLGVLYGGFFRMKMRQTYDLPKRRWFFGHAATTDFITWMLCSVCALAQEVRTAEYYDIYDSKFYEREGEGEGGGEGEGEGGGKWKPSMETVPSMHDVEGGSKEDMNPPEEMEMEGMHASTEVPKDGPLEGSHGQKSVELGDVGAVANSPLSEIANEVSDLRKE